MVGPKPAANGGSLPRDPAYEPRHRYGPPPHGAFLPWAPVTALISVSDRTRWLGGITTIIGLVTLSLAFAGGATAAQQAAASATTCTSGGWSDTVTVTNSPVAANGDATIGGTGTALDGVVLPAGGGHQSLVLGEQVAVKAVTVSGTLSWAKGYHAPFSTTGLKPTSCGPASNSVNKAAVPVHAAANTPNTSAPKYYVCKYVGTPGQNERLQTGNNPIDVSGNAIGEDPVVVGSSFNDAQGRSFVLAEDTGQNPPTIDDCPEPTTTVTATATAPGPTVTVTGPTQTVTVTQGVTTTATSTVTATETTTVTGDPVTVEVPGPTVTLTVTPAVTAPGTTQTTTMTAPGTTQTTTVTAPGTTTTETATAPGATQTTTVTAAGTASTQTQTVTQTVTVTETVPGCDPGGVAAVACPTTTVTETVVGPGSTQTDTVTAPGDTVTVTQAIDATQTAISCPPGAQVEGVSAGPQALGGSLAYTGSGDDPMMSLLGGALTAAGLTLLFMARKRWSPRRH
jgi:hypothetical protein